MGFASTNRESTREKKTWIQDTFEVQKPWSKPRAITHAIARGTHSESIGWYLVVSSKRGTPKSSLNGIFHYGPSVLGYPHGHWNPHVVHRKLDESLHEMAVWGRSAFSGRIRRGQGDTRWVSWTTLVNGWVSGGLRMWMGSIAIGGVRSQHIARGVTW